MKGENLKIAFLGNMNNNHFALARFIRDRGYNVDVLIFNDEFDHFHPSADTYDLSFMSYCKQLTWGGSRTFNSVSRKSVEQELDGYDIIIGCGLAPAYCEKIRRRLDIFIPYGGDIWTETFYRLVNPLYFLSVCSAVYHQRKGIRNVKIVNVPGKFGIYEKQLEKYKGNSKRWDVGTPIVYSGIYSPDKILDYIDRTYWGHEFKKIRSGCDLMLMYHVRHMWGHPLNPPGQKGTDRLIKGFAMFLKNNPHISAKLITLEYGKNVKESKLLIQELGIEHAVVWLPKMNRKDLMIGVHFADIICGEFIHSWIGSGVIYEALALAKPLLEYRNDKEYQEQYPELYPIMNADNPKGISDMLSNYVQDPAKYKEMGISGKLWYDKYIVYPSLAKFMDYFDSLKKSNE